MARHLLPKDLLTALAGLSETDFVQLLDAVLREAGHRGQMDIPPTAAKAMHTAHEKLPALSRSSPLSLSTAKINAIRAAHAAGVTPAVIARKFGVSPSTLKTIIEEAKDRRP